jgi:hypothetical protein
VKKKSSNYEEEIINGRMGLGGGGWCGRGEYEDGQSCTRRLVVGTYTQTMLPLDKVV